MNEMINNFEGNNVVVEIIGGKPMFEIYSVGFALGYQDKRTSKGKVYVTPRKDRIEKILENIGVSGLRQGDATFITESELYDFMLESKTEKCRPFRKWVVEEVLPTIRQTGGFVAEDRESEFVDIYFPTFSDDVKLAMVQDLLKSNKELKPKAENYELLMNSKGNIDFGQFVKSANLKLGRNNFISLLRDKSILMQKGTAPTQRYVNSGYFEVVQTVNNGFSNTKTVLTKKGQDWMINKCREWNVL
jgi:phage antirepressor YoqD-like protein